METKGGRKMPRTNLSRELDSVRDLGTLLGRWQRYYDLDDEAVGRQLRMSARTWARRKAEPRNLTVQEFWRAVKVLKIPQEAARDALLAGMGG